MKTTTKTFYVKLCTPYWVGIFDVYPQWSKHRMPFWEMSVEDWKHHIGQSIKQGEIKIMTMIVEDE